MEFEVNKPARFHLKRSRSLEPGEIDADFIYETPVKSAKYKHKQIDVAEEYKQLRKQNVKYTNRTTTMGRTTFKPQKPKPKPPVFTRNKGENSKQQTFVIQTSNSYEVLSGKEEEHDEVIVTKPKTLKKSKLPPIIVQGISKKDLTNRIKSLKVENYHLRFTSMGVNVYVENAKQFNIIRENLKKDGVLFFTHDLPEEKHVKVVLRDFYKMEHNELKVILAEEGLKPVEIRTIIPKRARFTEHVLYVLSFLPDGFNMNEIKSIKTIDHIEVKWERYRKMTTGMTQCRRCMTPGHGTRNCHLGPRCKYCSEGHLSDTCSKVDKAIDDTGVADKMEEDTNKDDPVTIKFSPTCCNCGGKHFATDQRCPKLIEYMELQRSLATRNRNPVSKKQFVLNPEHFPVLHRSERQPNVQQQPRVPAPGLRTFSQVTRQSMPNNHQTRSGYPNNNYEFNKTNPNESIHSPPDLFTFDEINALLQDVLRGLRGARDRNEQFGVITSLALKYLYDGTK